MPASKKTRRGLIGAVLLAGALTIGGYALTDVLVVPADSHAGDGQDAILQLTATNFHYSLNTTNPANVDSIDFDLDDNLLASGTVYVQPDSVAGTWYECVITGTVNGVAAADNHPVCDTTAGTQLAAVDIDQVRVVAAD